MSTVRERVKNVLLGAQSGQEGSMSTSPDGAPGTGSGESVASLSSLASDARKAGKRVKKIDEERKRIELEQEVNELFEKEQWEELASWYFDLRYVMTGWDGFRLDEKQKGHLGLTFGKTMKVLLKIDPAYIAMILFFANFSSLITRKEAAWYQIRKHHAARKEVEERQRRDRAANPAEAVL